MNYMRYGVVIKMIWNIGLVGLAIITTIIGLNNWELNKVFYIVAIEFFVWFMLNEILQMFQPVPVLLPPPSVRRKSNDNTEN